MRIRYHFLVDLHITRHMLETESEKRIWNTLNEPCGVELIILQAKVIIIDPQPYWSTHFFVYHREFTMDLSRESQTSMNAFEFEESVLYK